MKTDPYYQQQKCRPVATFWWYKDYVGVCRVPWGGGIKRQWGCREQRFLAFLLAISLEALEMRPALLIAIRSTSSAFQWSQNTWPWMTLDGYFALNSVIAPVCLASDRANVEHNCMKTNKDRHTPSAAQIFGKDSFLAV